jgi:hypothetical protein
MLQSRGSELRTIRVDTALAPNPVCARRLVAARFDPRAGPEGRVLMEGA